MPLTTRMNLRIVATQTKAADGGNGVAPYEAGIAEAIWRSGVGYDEADLVFSDTRTLSASSNEDLNLVGGFTDQFGVTVSPAKIKAFIIENMNTGTQVLTVKQAASNGWTGLTTGGVLVQPGSSQMSGMFFQIAPKGVSITDSTGDLVNVANGSGSSCEYRVTVLATSS